MSFWSLASFFLFSSSIFFKLYIYRFKTRSSFSKSMILWLCWLVSSDRLVRVTAMMSLREWKFSKPRLWTSSTESYIWLNLFANSIQLREKSGSARFYLLKYLRSYCTWVRLKAAEFFCQKLPWFIEWLGQDNKVINWKDSGSHLNDILELYFQSKLVTFINI